MYNRYIPQRDGSHVRKSCPEPIRHQPVPYQKEPVHPPAECAKSTPPPPPSHPHYSSQQGGSAFGFLKKLVPADFDTGDLIILLLLLLMAGDCQEDQNWAWLTLALYLFL